LFVGFTDGERITPQNVSVNLNLYNIAFFIYYYALLAAPWPAFFPSGGPEKR
jgi:hypothetical protein